MGCKHNIVGSFLNLKSPLVFRPHQHNINLRLLRGKNTKSITTMALWMTIAAAVAAALAYFTVRFLDSRRELRMLQRMGLVSDRQS